jgi:NAD(P) transhydrogenase subunit alpha
VDNVRRARPGIIAKQGETMIVGVPRENSPGERRVALTPAVIPALAKAGWEVVVEAGAGAAAGYPDVEYEAKGARILPQREDVFRDADAIVQVLCHGANDKTGKADIPLLHVNQALIGFLRPLGDLQTVKDIAGAGVFAFSVEMMPRTTRAQSMDALSSMGTIAGYKAVLIAADTLPRMFPMMTTAAGTLMPARVLVIGTGVAGLQAIATARRLGAVVSAYDIRPAAKEQVQSLGARFVELAVEATDAQDAGGYAKAQGEEFYQRQRELLGKVVAESDVVITAAVIPGKKSPILVTADMVERMAPGSVIVDLAAERGGNCEATKTGELKVEHGVSVIGWINLASSMPYHASQMYARNISAFLLHLFGEKGAGGSTASSYRERLNDEIIRSTLITQDGEVVNGRVREFYGLPPLQNGKGQSQ